MNNCSKVKCDLTRETQMSARDDFNFAIVFLLLISIAIIPIFLIDTLSPNKSALISLNGSTKHQFKSMDVIRNNAKNLIVLYSLYLVENDSNIISGQYSYNVTLELSDQTIIKSINQKNVYLFHKRIITDILLKEPIKNSKKYSFEINFDFFDLKIQKLFFKIFFDFTSGIEHTVISTICSIFSLVFIIKFIFQFRVMLPNIQQIQVFILSIFSAIVVSPFFRCEESFVFNSIFSMIYHFISISLIDKNSFTSYASIVMCWVSLFIDFEFPRLNIYSKIIWVIFILTLIIISLYNHIISITQLLLTIVPPIFDLLRFVLQKHLVYSWQLFIFSYWPFYVGSLFRLFLSMPILEKSKEILKHNEV